MAEYIEREATIELLRSIGSRDYRREKGTIQEAIKMVSFSEYTPAADVVEVRHGRWEEAEDDYCGLHIIKCSECREEWCFEVDDDVKDLNYNYCPNCGALMMGESNGKCE